MNLKIEGNEKKSTEDGVSEGENKLEGRKEEWEGGREHKRCEQNRRKVMIRTRRWEGGWGRRWKRIRRWKEKENMKEKKKENLKEKEKENLKEKGRESEGE